MWELGIAVAAIIIAIALMILVAFLVPAILQLRQTARQLEATTANMDKTLPSIMANLDEIASNVAAITSTGRRQLEALDGSVQEVKQMIDDVVAFEKRLKRKVESPLINSAGTISAAARAIQAFTAVMSGQKKRRK
ncbi:MAG: DUF948 domain-containing protein [Calditrichaeota bacterium]|nr:DUF948 domain-containing protein [Calditrichota bacterium]MCB0294215.1 DUF948 domain-containing protein [Calditrichota bacterium]MCB0303534.1 DUF948 domain-containing protein [Calditrichota bacterium]MCB0313607.1 DUF948 domain-containing protein [Calditrichota bacterium]MCB9088681.1 DUF948 domain-containing protein [Calditrichia bacterium]